MNSVNERNYIDFPENEGIDFSGNEGIDFSGNEGIDFSENEGMLTWRSTPQPIPPPNPLNLTKVKVLASHPALEWCPLLSFLVE